MDKSAKKVILDITNYLLDNFNEYIVLLSLHGSAAHDAMYNGASDIDFVLITSHEDFKKNEQIMNYVRISHTNFKVDISFTPKSEVENERSLNYKAMHTLYLIQNGIISCLYKNVDFCFYISDYSMKESARFLFWQNLTDIRRIISDFKTWPDRVNGQRKILKALYYTLQCFLLLRNIYPKNVGNCLEEFSKISNIKYGMSEEIALRKKLTNENDLEYLREFCLNCTQYLTIHFDQREAFIGNKNDLRIKTDSAIFKVRVGSLMMHHHKYLLVNMDKSKYWCVPGGHIELTENSEQAAIREFNEETGVECEIDKLFLLNENFYTKKDKVKFHELAFYYLVKLKNGSSIIEDKIIQEYDNGILNHLEFRWFSREELSNIEIKPAIIKDLIINDKIKKLNHIISCEY